MNSKLLQITTAAAIAGSLLLARDGGANVHHFSGSNCVTELSSQADDIGYGALGTFPGAINENDEDRREIICPLAQWTTTSIDMNAGRVFYSDFSNESLSCQAFSADLDGDVFNGAVRFSCLGNDTGGPQIPQNNGCVNDTEPQFMDAAIAGTQRIFVLPGIPQVLEPASAGYKCSLPRNEFSVGSRIHGFEINTVESF